MFRNLQKNAYNLRMFSDTDYVITRSKNIPTKELLLNFNKLLTVVLW